LSTGPWLAQARAPSPQPTPPLITHVPQTVPTHRSRGTSAVHHCQDHMTAASMLSCQAITAVTPWAEGSPAALMLVALLTRFWRDLGGVGSLCSLKCCHNKRPASESCLGTTTGPVLLLLQVTQKAGDAVRITLMTQLLSLVLRLTS